METCTVALRIVGSVVFLHNIVNKNILKTRLISYRLLQEYKLSFHILVARGQSTLDCLDIMANNQNPCGENPWDFYLRPKLLSSIWIHKAALRKCWSHTANAN